jgi:hypothetical protein
MRATELERMLAQYIIGGIALTIIGTLIGLYILYLVIRWAVRDGMLDAQRGSRGQREPVRTRTTATRADLPDMRAD